MIIRGLQMMTNNLYFIIILEIDCSPKVTFSIKRTQLYFCVTLFINIFLQTFIQLVSASAPFTHAWTHLLLKRSVYPIINWTCQVIVTYKRQKKKPLLYGSSPKQWNETSMENSSTWNSSIKSFFPCTLCSMRNSIVFQQPLSYGWDKYGEFYCMKWMYQIYEKFQFNFLQLQWTQ
jgi:hypothetical protein